MWRPLERTGFAPPASRPIGGERRAVALAQLLATLGLTIGTIIAAVAITAGIAEADMVGSAARHRHGLLAVTGVAALFAAVTAVGSTTDRSRS